MLKRGIMLLVAVILISPTAVFSQQSKGEVSRQVIEELAKDLIEFNKLIIQLQQFLEKLTPEERQQLCENLQKKYEENPPPIPIQFKC